MVEYSVATTPEERESARSLIRRVFVDDMGLVGVDADGFDADAVFLIGQNGAGVVAALRVIVDGPQGLPLDGHADLTRLRSESRLLVEASRLACLEAHRSNLVGLRGVGFLKSIALELHASHVVIDSLLALAPLYSRIGFVPAGDPFVDDSVCRPGESCLQPNALVMWASVEDLRGW